jgi:hypothetical protein
MIMLEPSGKIRKTVSFNKKNEKDLPLLERIESVGNFNDYIKRLIEKDVRSRKIIKAENKPVQPLNANGEIKVSGLSVIPN